MHLFKIKLMFFTALFALAPIAAEDRITVSIGDGVLVCTTLPFYIEENYSYSQQIYLQSEINLPGYQVEKLIFTSANDAAFLDTDVVIYLGHTSMDLFESSADFVDLSELTEVYSGAVYTPASGEIEIELDTPFPYNNVDNLVLAYDENTPGSPGMPNYWCAYGWYGHRTMNNNGDFLTRSIRTWHWSDIDPADPFQSTGGNERLSSRNNIQMIMAEQPEVIEGDLNNDGDVNILDVVLLANTVLDNSYSQEADLNSDGTVNILDIVMLVNIILS